ncbi:hypothetical protein HNQ64_003249 [Prosthecobacter dejongeii]|uniref:Uncharacterized protein n=2 Tax=Prosthecobacter dejongeii TaxID=48465 RepID=A0A7W7YMU8_9BACT|nr:hypothetical protein [Prosthecobacter dejongeii]
MAQAHQIECSNCQSEMLEGESFCHECGALQFKNELLNDLAAKVKFSQNKLRESFPTEIQKHFEKDEYIHASTYGPEEYYILSDRKLYIGSIVGKGLFVRKYELANLKRVVDLKRVTRFTDWSELFYASLDFDGANPFMALQIETFEGDINVTVNAFDSNEGLFQDPYYFQMLLEEVIQNIQSNHVHQHEALWRSK